jgi:hypothetical protein
LEIQGIKYFIPISLLSITVVATIFMVGTFDNLTVIVFAFILRIMAIVVTYVLVTTNESLEEWNPLSFKIVVIISFTLFPFLIWVVPLIPPSLLLSALLVILFGAVLYDLLHDLTMFVSD